MVDRLEKLRKSFTKMSDDSLIAYVTDLRKDRMTSKHQDKQKKKTQKNIMDKLEDKLAGMDPEALRKLLS
ncbi:hypothetical protein CMI37_09085 [Candidatus Pacearchaeota archaeon]|nr:hypothetical protein [Candidatus Pacearchaeota archaeon]|tara:strand:- start:716 stop:925 length:210 start_codon:yes stop_codon:yes gene_type:complete